MYIRNTATDLADFFEKCKQHRLKVTPQRTAVYYALTANQGHPSADDVYQKLREEFPNISFDTVNRTMITFAGIGIIEVIEGNGDPRRFDSNLTEHHHFYCVGCGKIEDFYDATFDHITVPSEISERCVVLSKRIVLKGYCAACRK